MIKPKQQNEALIADIAGFESNDSFKVWWLGQSGFLLKYKSETLLFDPYLSDSLSKKYEHTDKPHVRMSELVVSPALLRNIDVLTSSHNHTDHLDAETLHAIFEHNPEAHFVFPVANREFIKGRLGIEFRNSKGLTQNETLNIGTFEITALPAAHNEMEKDEQGRCRFLSFVVRFDDFAVYHSGDTLWYDGLEKRLAKEHLDLAFLPINGNKPERRVAGNLNYREAAELGKIANIQCVIPHHYHLFEFNTEDPENFKNACLETGTPFKVLELGEGIEFSKN
ncbi:MBL fold metallo-hydrolase [Jiulongibacter sediminis]|uniref:MBL fold metallo-hydrolase n=1 Tax=Jiulongibacter sediminis TaxID=1605367 RepID=UPI0026EF9B38|nr:MBL fold metallo-hydrolase [Jiulongibacter sediminis]